MGLNRISAYNIVDWNMLKRKWLLLCIALAVITVILLGCTSVVKVGHSMTSSFDGFNNETGEESGCYLVPNYVHFLRFNDGSLSFGEAVCVLAAFHHQRPEKLFIHTNVEQKGKYWDIIRSVPGMNDTLAFRNVSLPMEIFGQKVNPKWKVYHGGDVTRLRILMELGGIFLDNDSYIVRSLNELRKYELVLGWQLGKSLQNQVILANRDARFLRKWLESYRDHYRPKMWYYNAGTYPTAILEREPYLVHRIPERFGQYGVVRKVFQTKWPEWRSYYAVHLMIRHQYLFKSLNKQATFPVVFNERNIHKYPIAFRDMAYDVYPFKKAQKVKN